MSPPQREVVISRDQNGKLAFAVRDENWKLLPVPP